MNIKYSLIAISVILTFQWACSSSDNSEKKSTTITDFRALEKLMPKDEALAEKYKRSCYLCHINPDAKAPLVSDESAWNKLINEKGIPTLLKHINEGYKAMPAKGQCADCTDEDYEVLIDFMAGAEL